MSFNTKEEYSEFLCNLKIPSYLSMVDKYGYFLYDQTENCDFKYKFYKLPLYEYLYNKYNLRQIAKDGGTIEQSINIMNFLTNHTFYNGMANGYPTTTEAILDISFDKGFQGAVNCTNKAILLSSFLLAVNIFAMPVILNANDGEYGGCHCVVQVYVPEMSKWIMLDPSFNCYITNADNEILDLYEIHKAYKNNETLIINNYLFNGDSRVFKDKYLLCFLVSHIFEITVEYDNTPLISEDPNKAPIWKSNIIIVPSDYKNEERLPNHVNHSYCDIFNIPKWEA